MQIAARGTDFCSFSDDEKHAVAAAVPVAGAIKAVLGTPILTGGAASPPMNLRL